MTSTNTGIGACGNVSPTTGDTGRLLAENYDRAPPQHVARIHNRAEKERKVSTIEISRVAIAHARRMSCAMVPVFWYLERPPIVARATQTQTENQKSSQKIRYDSGLHR